jgi:phosphoglycolate phosphatase-like HAD superfamily hydrolase
LENLAETLDKNSAAYAALKRAGWALAFATMHHHDEFEQFLTNYGGELTSDQIAHLKEPGLE